MMNRSPFQALAWSRVFALAGFGCGSGDEEFDPCAAYLSINLEVDDGTLIDEVSYVIRGDDMPDMGDTIHTSAPGSTASVEAFGIPEGGPYVVEMIATSVDGKVTCGGSDTFTIASGVRTEVDLILHCKAAQEFGGVRVNGQLNICAVLDKVVAAPLQTATGYGFALQAAASDEEGDTVEYSWSATGGSFEDPDAASTVFTCTEDGQERITVEISDDGFKYCVGDWMIDVNCVPDDEGAGGSGGDGGGGDGGSGGDGDGGSGGDGGGGSGGDGSGGSGGDGSGGSGGDGGDGGGGSGGNIPEECLVSLSVR